MPRLSLSLSLQKKKQLLFSVVQKIHLYLCNKNDNQNRLPLQFVAKLIFVNVFLANV